MPSRVRLTQRLVSRLRLQHPVNSQEVWHMDTDVAGFGVRLRASGGSVYAVRYRDHLGKERKFTIGSTKAMRLDAARKLAIKHLAEVHSGQDPVDARRRARAHRAVTVRELGQETVEHLRSQDRTPEYITDCETFLRKYIIPAIGDHELQAVTPRQVERLVRSLKDTPRTGNRVRALLSRMFKLATRWRYRPDDPTVGIEKFPERARERHFSPEELRRLLDALDTSRAQQSANAVRLLLFTGSRPKELLSATWDQFDLDAGLWTKPAMTVKTRSTHQVELSQEALGVLRGMREEQQRRAPGAGHNSPFLFQSDSARGHLTTIRTFWKLVTRRAGLENARIYDLRKTFATLLLARGVDLRTVMALTGHTQAQTLLKHYAHAVPGKQREALQGLFTRAS